MSNIGITAPPMSADRSVTYRNKKWPIDGSYGHHYIPSRSTKTVEIQHEETIFGACWSSKIGEKLGGGVRLFKTVRLIGQIR